MVMNRWKDHFVEVLNVATVEDIELPDDYDLSDTQKMQDIETGPSTEVEKTTAIKTQQRKKSGH